VIEGIFEVRRKNYEDFPSVVEGLDLVDEEDQITHEVDLLDENIKGEESLNIFKALPPEQFVAEEAKWKQVSAEILGLEDDDADSDSSDDSDDEEEARQADQKAQEKIVDFTEQDLINLRRSIYLVIMSSLHHEECVHKILKLNIADGQEKEVCTMLIDCCAMERMYNRFFSLQAERLCRMKPEYQDRFTESFSVQFATVHRLETNKLRNIGKFFTHLLFTDAISWSIMSQIRITEETTTSSSRIFVKVIFQELSEQWGIKKLSERLKEPDMQGYFAGLFPRDHPKNMRFAINYFTAVGLGVLTEDLRDYLAKNGTYIEPTSKGPTAAQLEDASTSDSDSDSSSDSSSSSS
jgi:pre-mRNA-splicing factor CWC22